MNRPYIVCHILSALDGKITGAFMGMCIRLFSAVPVYPLSVKTLI